MNTNEKRKPQTTKTCRERFIEENESDHKTCGWHGTWNACQSSLNVPDQHKSQYMIQVGIQVGLPNNGNKLC